MRGEEGVGNGIEDEPELLKNPERDRDDNLGGCELDSFTAVAREYLDAAPSPLDSFDRTRELDAGTCLPCLPREKLGKPLVAFADAKEFVALDLLFCVLLNGEGVDPDLAMVSGIEAFYITDDLFAFLRRELLEGRIVCESQVRPFPLFQAAEEFEDLTLLVALLEPCIFVAVADALDFVGLETGFVDQVPKLRGVAVDELGAEFEDLAVCPISTDATAHAAASFENKYLAARLCKEASGGEPGHAGTDHQNSLLRGFHYQIGCGEGVDVIARIGSPRGRRRPSNCEETNQRSLFQTRRAMNRFRQTIYCYLAASVAAMFSLTGSAQQPEAMQPEPDATTTLHHIKTVFVIVMENHNWTGAKSENIKGNSEAPYINYTLLPMASHANDYKNPPGIHPSLPNYLWLEAGTGFGIKDDGPPSQHNQTTHNHLVKLLENAGISWRSYDENISGTNCPLTNQGATDSNGHQLYQVHHNPFVYFSDQTNNRSGTSKNCIAHIRPFTQFAHDLSANTVARYNFIVPNLCHDMHDTCGGNAIAHGDTWLKNTVPEILHSTAYRSGGVLFITWDEAAAGDGPIPMIVLSPYAKGNYYSNSTYYTHSSTLRTIQEIFGVYPLIRNAGSATDLRAMFSVFP